MKIEYISDLHLEHNYVDFTNVIPKAEVLILAGDICSIRSPNLKLFLDCITNKWKYIFYVLGNHEYINIDCEIEEIKKMYKSFFNQYNNVILLDNDVYELKNDDKNGNDKNNENSEDVVIIGSTLWTSIPLNLREFALKNVSDFKKIKTFSSNHLQGYYKHQYTHMVACHFIESNLERYNGKKIVVVTHHAPYKCGTSHPKYENKDVGTCGYSSDLYNIFKNRNLVWIFGHTHYKCNFNIENVKICSNPYRNYEKDLINIELFEI